MALYRVTDFELTKVANAIREKGGTSAELEFPDGYVEAIENLPSGGGTDVSDTTATAGDVLAGKYFHTADGTKTQGTITAGSATTPNTLITSTPNISVDSSGLITASHSNSVTITPTVTAGYISTGTSGTISTGGSATSQLPTQAAQTITPTTTDQTIASGKYLTGAQTIKGDANLVAGNIKKDVQIFGVTGTHEGGGGGAVKNDVTFYDYDGTIVTSYSATDFAQLSAMPANPSHTGLVAQGWNWSLADAKTYVAKYGELNIGQMYITQSGATEIDVVMPEGRLSPILTIAVNGAITVDWGDGTASDTLIGGDLTYQLELSHAYAQAGAYTISISATEDYKYRFYCSTSYTLLRKNTTENQNKVYSNAIQHIRIGSNAEIGSYAFYNCYSLASITIPDGVTSIGTYAFQYCYSLTSITMPDSMTTIDENAFSTCLSLTSIIIPNSVTSIGYRAFASCFSLASITIPNSVTSAGNYVFNSCYALSSVIISENLTSIGECTFNNCYSLANVIIPEGVESIGNNAFYNCYSLANITIPSSITNIVDRAFQNCHGVKEYHILPTTVPTAGSTIFSNNSSDIVIYVPSASLSAYKTATNWSTYASKMRGE